MHNTMKHVMLTLFSLWICTSISAQVQTPSLLSPGGGLATSTSMDLSWSLGELAVLTWYSDPALCTEGFQQPDQTGSVMAEPDRSRRKILSDDPGMEVSVAPNPVLSNLSITFSKPLAQPAMLTVYAAVGQVVDTEQLPAGSATANLDCGRWQPGVYYLQFLSITDASSTVVPLIKQ